MEAMRAGLERSIQIVRATDEYKRRRSLPSLTGRDRVSDVKYDDSGRIYTSWWYAKETEDNEEGKRVLVNPKGVEYIILSPQRVRPDYLNDLPKKVPVVELILGEVEDGIVKAIGQSRHILGGYISGTEATEVKQARRVIQHVDRLASKFVGERVTSRDLELLARETRSFLEKEKLVSPRDPNKRKEFEMLVKIPQKDILGRVNPLVSRIRARAAYLAATKRLIVGGFVVEKFSTNLQVLIYEEEMTRWVIENAAKQVEIYILGITAFRRPGSEDTDIQRRGMANMALTISEELQSTVRVKPYLAPSRDASKELAGAAELLMQGGYSQAGPKIRRSIEILKQAVNGL